MKFDGDGSNTAFLDIIMNMMMVFMVLFALAALQIRPEVKEKRKPVLPTDGKFALVLTWPDKSKSDVDLYVMDPTGRVAFFRQRDVGLMNLEYDDLGQRSDMQDTAHGKIAIEKNMERTILRGVVPGEYVVNVHMYSMLEHEPIDVTVRLFRLIGDDTEIIKKTKRLTFHGHEVTMFRFTLTADNQVRNVNEMERPIVSRAKDRTGGGGQ
jgi:hypothetical protein